MLFRSEGAIYIIEKLRASIGDEEKQEEFDKCLDDLERNLHVQLVLRFSYQIKIFAIKERATKTLLENERVTNEAMKQKQKETDQLKEMKKHGGQKDVGKQSHVPDNEVGGNKKKWRKSKRNRGKASKKDNRMVKKTQENQNGREAKGQKNND